MMRRGNDRSEKKAPLTLTLSPTKLGARGQEKTSETRDYGDLNQARISRGRRGVTLVEVLAATMLSVVLLTAINGILRSMQTQRKALAGDTGAAEWRRSLVDQLTWDVLNSRRIHVRANRVRLIGYAGRDAATGMPQHRPTEVVYHVFVEEGQSWLVREESRLDDRTNRNWTRELVAHDVGSIKLFRVDSTGDEHDLEAGAAAQTEPFAIPGHMRFVIGTGEGRELVSGRVSRTW